MIRMMQMHVDEDKYNHDDAGAWTGTHTHIRPRSRAHIATRHVCAGTHVPHHTAEYTQQHSAKVNTWHTPQGIIRFSLDILDELTKYLRKSNKKPRAIRGELRMGGRGEAQRDVDAMYETYEHTYQGYIEDFRVLMCAL